MPAVLITTLTPACPPHTMSAYHLTKAFVVSGEMKSTLLHSVHLEAIEPLRTYRMRSVERRVSGRQCRTVRTGQIAGLMTLVLGVIIVGFAIS